MKCLNIYRNFSIIHYNKQKDASRQFSGCRDHITHFMLLKLLTKGARENKR